jgi:hypothetical protein
MVLGTHLFLLSNGLSVAKAPYPRERFLGFTLLGACVGLVTGATPAAAILAAVALAAHARENNHQEAVRQAAGAWPPAPHYVPPWPR